MFNGSREEEVVYLRSIIDELNGESDRLDRLMSKDSESIQEFQKYMHDKVYEMDPMEVRANRQIIESMVDSAYNLSARKKRTLRMIASPYFGRIAFSFDDKSLAGSLTKGSVVDETGIFQVYIGIHSYMRGTQNVIYDWRAPISSMFYDYETGKAQYTAPKSYITGEISLKRQYKITAGQLEYMLENSLKIDDDILVEQLSKATSDKMKNIVATIQREQNAIIRDEKSDILIIQGVAGSGKTSIALHRIAYLLYRLKNKIFSENMMIISPNKVFSDYISNVLPELGEEQILQMTFDDIAEHELLDICEYQNLYGQVSELLENYDEFLIKRIKYKSSVKFLEKINEYISHVENSSFTAETFYYTHEEKDFEIGDYYLNDRYNAYKRYPMMKRADMIIEDIIDKIIDYFNIKRSKIRAAQIRNRVYGMLKEINLLKLYANMYKYFKIPDMYAGNVKDELPYDDVAPLLYLKSVLFGVDSFLYVQHLLIDEMQDYTPVHYAFFNKLFVCKKTILGDVNQLVNPFNESSSQESIAEIYGKIPKTAVTTMRLHKSYRSTTEITEFARKIIPNDKIEVIERHGDEPDIIKCGNIESECKEIKNLICKYTEQNFKSIGVICKTKAQAENIYKLLTAGENLEITYLTEASEKFDNRLVVTTAYLAKGLEFDCVILPDTDSGVYVTDLDRQMLYIGVTRALHRLTLLYTGEASAFVPV
jgi:DNA helicase-2/ATP-dependent DNA helicase PcrA